MELLSESRTSELGMKTLSYINQTLQFSSGHLY